MSLDPTTFKAPFLTREAIRFQAEQFREKFWANPLPVDVLAILEFDLAFEIRPVKNLLSDVDVDALLLADFQTMLVDQDEYMDDRYANRLRFSVAHELGHYILHREIWEGVPVNDSEDWIRFMQALPEEEYRWLENHANEFAGRLLVPEAILRTHYEQAKSKVPKAAWEWDASGETVRQYIADALSSEFGVSSQVLEKRLLFESL